MKIQLDFEGQSMLFEDPIKVIASYQLDSIENDLAQISDYAKQGYYIAGYLAYESAMAFNDYNKTKSAQNQEQPLLLFGVFKNYKSVSETEINQTYCQKNRLNLVSNTTYTEYAERIDKIKQQIKQGNTYQTNYTVQLTGQFDENPYPYYQFLQQNNQANYCAYIEYNDVHILSISPELFFKLNHQHLITKPMKGTAARGKTLEEDLRQRLELFSEKNQAENMMIVDLLRNDLSRISMPGSVTVSQLFEAEKYPTVWQLTSTIESDLKPDTDLFHLFQALFPCGSITGAPKASTMNLIAQLEKAPRQVYCGTIGYISPHIAQAVFNIPIRTLTVKNRQATYGVGGGVTWDSTQTGEYEELIQKTAILNQSETLPQYLIESLLLDQGCYFLMDLHIKRLTDSAAYFDYPFDVNSLCQRLEQFAKRYPREKYKVRVRLASNGEFSIDCDPILKPMQINKISLAPTHVDCSNVYLYHKTSNRRHFPAMIEGQEYLCYNQNGQITEFVYGNIVLLINDQWLTPPISSGLLAGTLRQHYLDEESIIEQSLSLADVLSAKKMAFINSVRQWIAIKPHVFNDLKFQVANMIDQES